MVDGYMREVFLHDDIIKKIKCAKHLRFAVDSGREIAPPEKASLALGRAVTMPQTDLFFVTYEKEVKLRIDQKFFYSSARERALEIEDFNESMEAYSLARHASLVGICENFTSSYAHKVHSLSLKEVGVDKYMMQVSLYCTPRQFLVYRTRKNSSFHQHWWKIQRALSA